jgi:excisionase family DNA binding protein
MSAKLINSKLHDLIVSKWSLLDSRRPLPVSVVEKLRNNFRSEFVYNSNAIEGNTLTLRETTLVINEGMTIGNKSIREIEEARNHPEAIEYVEEFASDKRRIRESDIFSLHQILMKGSLDQKYVGTYRKGDIRIEGSKHIPPPAYEVPHLMAEFIDLVNENPEDYTTVELASLVLHRFVQIHPFQDGNGRMARLLMNLVLLRKRYPPIVVLKSDRRKYLNYLEKADRHEYRRLINFIAQCVIKHLNMYLNALEQKPEEKLLSFQEAGHLFRISPTYLRVLANKGLIAATKDGRNWKIPRNELSKYIETHKMQNK